MQLRRRINVYLLVLCICVCIFVHEFMDLFEHVCACLHMLIHACMCVCMFIHVCAFMYVSETLTPKKNQMYVQRIYTTFHDLLKII